MRNGFSDAFGRIKALVEMGMFFQISEVRRNLINHRSAFPRASKETFRAAPLDDSKPCLSIPPGVTNKHDIAGALSDVYPIYHAVSQHLGKLVLRHYTGFDDGIYSIYPCPPNTRLAADAREQFWYRSAFVEKMFPWSNPYVDDITGRNVMAVSLPIEKTEENYFGVTSLIIPVDSLLEAALSVVSVPENAFSMICTVDHSSDTGQFGAKIVAYARSAKEMNYEWADVQ